jgi:hypothetical protein
LVGTDLVHVDLGVSYAVAAGPTFVIGPPTPTGDTPTARSLVALWDQAHSGGDHSPADDSNRGKVDDVRSQRGDEYEELFDSGGFRSIFDTDKGLGTDI